MQKKRQIKFRTEHRAGYEEYNWEQEPVSVAMQYINSEGKYLYEAFAALSEFSEFEKEFRNGLSKFGKKDAKLGYYVALFLNRFDKEKYILPDDFYFRINQAIEPNEIDELLKL